MASHVWSPVQGSYHVGPWHSRAWARPFLHHARDMHPLQDKFYKHTQAVVPNMSHKTWSWVPQWSHLRTRWAVLEEHVLGTNVLLQNSRLSKECQSWKWAHYVGFYLRTIDFLSDTKPGISCGLGLWKAFARVAIQRSYLCRLACL